MERGAEAAARRSEGQHQLQCAFGRTLGGREAIHPRLLNRDDEDNGHTTNPTGLPVGLAAAKDRALSFGFSTADVARCHVIGAQLGGFNLAVDYNLRPCWQNPVNSPRMLRVENKVRRHARGEVLIYSVTPVYLSSGSTVPWGFVMRASSSDPAGEVVWSDATYVPNVRYRDGKALSLAN
ncbi:DNA/RNA non-specific endonuclease [Streptomyces sp. NPDC057413]|uniref:DNA/RNA non-specific endonuclease n=1 Tax=Streptomyces sp. NPDC057413 TaxID=3346124 RepID=UPI0036939D4C